MDYIQLKIEIEPYSGEISEIFIAELANMGYEGFFEEGKTLHAYLPALDFRENRVNNMLKKDIFRAVNVQYSMEVIPEKNWNEIWEGGYEPVVIDSICMIRTEFHPPGDVENTIIIEPKMSFGTGHHETTRLMIRQMNQSSLKEKKVLDIGCGTGVLGIFALLRGAANVTAIDIDEWACTNSRENFERNLPGSNFNIIQGDAGKIPDVHFDVILANINRNVLMEDLPKYRHHLSSDGELILSGILEYDKHFILQSARKLKLLLNCEMSENNWFSLKFKRNNHFTS